MMPQFTASIEAVHTWRELLSRAISDPQERQRIAEALNVHPITLTRWATNKSNPRMDNLRPLLEALPQYRQQLTELIAEEFPNFFILSSTGLDEAPPAIPSAFYARVFNAYATSPPLLRHSTICILILQQIVSHFDPHQQGIAATIVRCVPPLPGKKVRSLRLTLGRGTPPWNTHLEHQLLFFGSESQAGQALMAGHAISVNTPETRERLFSTHQAPLVGSTAVYPILQSDSTPGCLCVVSTQMNYFSQDRLNLLKDYAQLMTVAFEAADFYHLNDLELGIMPPTYLQQPLLASFQQRITQYTYQVKQHNLPLTHTQIEQKVWQELEEELLQRSHELAK